MSRAAPLCRGDVGSSARTVGLWLVVAVVAAPGASLADRPTNATEGAVAPGDDVLGGHVQRPGDAENGTADPASSPSSSADAPASEGAAEAPAVALEAPAGTTLNDAAEPGAGRPEASPDADPAPSEPTGEEAQELPVDEAMQAGADVPPVRIAVYDFDVTDVDARVAAIVQEAVLTEVRKLRKVSAIGMDEVRAMLDLEAQRQMVGCDDENSCLAEIAGALGADVLVIGTLAKLSDQHIFGLRRIDQKNARVTGSVSRRLPAGDGEEFLAAVGSVVEELFPERELRDGQTRGVAEDVATRLNPPPLPPWSVYGVGTVAAAVVAASVVAAGSSAAFYVSFRLLALGASTTPVQGGELVLRKNATQVAAVLAGGLLVTGVLVASAAGVMALFTDWTGAGADPRDE